MEASRVIEGRGERINKIKAYVKRAIGSLAALILIAFLF